MTKWKCTVCGYVHEGEQPPEQCPVCGADRSAFVRLETQTDGVAEGQATEWRCSVCGYAHTGEEGPDLCPVCGAERDQFVAMEKAEKWSSPPLEQPAEGRPGETSAATDQHRETVDRLPLTGRWLEVSRMLTRFHGHPIAVHIPNGLLPVSVLFTILGLLFGSQSLAIAAKYNIIMVALAMPLVIATGWVDWINRFQGRMTPVFRIKMICAGLVTLLSLVLAVWWIAKPSLYLEGLSGNIFFLFIHFFNLAAAGVAGWYGGKLVFHQ